MTVCLCPAPAVSFAADEILLAVADAIGPVSVTSDRGVGGVTPLGRGDRRQVGGGSLVADVTGRRQSFVLLPGPVPAVHLPAVPVGVGAVDVVIPLEKYIQSSSTVLFFVLLILYTAVDWVLLLGDEPVGNEHRGEGVWGEVEPVHVLILHQGVAHLAALESEAAQEVLLVVQGQAGGLEHHSGTLVKTRRPLEYLKHTRHSID